MTKIPRTGDFEVRAALVSVLLEMGFPRADIRHELTLDSSSSDGRADVILTLDECLAGIEIKSGKDTLDRLEQQAERYGARFDQLFLAIDPRHHDAVSVTRYRSAWRHVLVVTEDFGRPMLKSLGGDPITGSVVRSALAARLGRSHRTSPYAMLEMLWAPEVRGLAGRLRLATGGTRHALIPFVGDRAGLAEIRREVVAYIRHRPLNRWEEAFWKRFDALPTAKAAA